MSAAVTNSISQYLVNCASLEDLNLFAMSQGNPYQQVSSSNKENADMDLNDELQVLQDVTCYSVYRKRCKKGRKYKEWKKDERRAKAAGNPLPVPPWASFVLRQAAE